MQLRMLHSAKLSTIPFGILDVTIGRNQSLAEMSKNHLNTSLVVGY